MEYDLNECLEIICWSKRALAEILNISPRLIQRWANGQNPTPDNVLEWLRGLAKAHDQFPLPCNWDCGENHDNFIEEARFG
jgi:hypothetical protein